MGYNIRIGNAVPEFHKDDGILDAYWMVKLATSEQAPVFPNDPMTKNSNERLPSYGAWADFCDQTGLRELFYADDGGLLTPHPGCNIITEEHHSKVSSALERWRRAAKLPPGFAGFPKPDPMTGEIATPDSGKYDHTLARLMWLEWWMRWALENCETPAIQNG